MRYFLLFLRILMAMLLKMFHSGPARQTEENKPATMPTISGSAKFLMEVTPRMYNIPMVKSVVTVVFIERPMLLRILSRYPKHRNLI